MSYLIMDVPCLECGDEFPKDVLDSGVCPACAHEMSEKLLAEMAEAEREG